MIFAISFLVIHWYLALFCQSFYLHRFVSHGMYSLSKFWNFFFCFLTIIAQGPSFLRPQHYKKLHFRHHLNSDKDGDPHSPITSGNIVKMMKKTYDEYMAIDEAKEDFPLLVKIGDAVLTRTLFIFVYIALYLLFTDSIWFLLLVPVHGLMGPIHGAIVNWCGHKYGYRNHELDDNSRNTLLIDILMMGELYQNNHHAAPEKPNFADNRKELDFTYIVMWFLARTKVIRYGNS